VRRGSERLLHDEHQRGDGGEQPAAALQQNSVIFSRRCFGRRNRIVDENRFSDEAIAAPRQRLDEPRAMRVVAQRRPDGGDAEVQAPIEIDEGVVPPQMAFQLVARHHGSRPAREQREYLRGLRGEVHAASGAMQLARLEIEIEDAEPQDRHRAAS
jgi:hypothetical protein